MTEATVRRRRGSLPAAILLIALAGFIAVVAVVMQSLYGNGWGLFVPAGLFLVGGAWAFRDWLRPRM